MLDALRHGQEPFTSVNAFMACGAPQESGSFDTQLMIPQVGFDKSLQGWDLEKHVQGCCPNGCPRIEIDSQLASLLAAWPSLDSCSRRTVIVLLEAVDMSNDDN
jgi:hypothetical protein